MPLPIALIVSTLMCLEATFTGASPPAPQASPPPGEEMVHIDGGKNPEMIPQWAIWEYAFRVIGGGPKQLPSSVHHLASSAEAAMVLAEAEGDLRRDAACQARMLKLRSLVQNERVDVINAKQAEIQIECRWQTLHARDRILERLRSEARAALIAFVESLKAGTKVTVSRRELAHYQQPQ
jgi:hypothetical protein